SIVAKEKHEPLALRERSNRIGHGNTPPVVARGSRGLPREPHRLPPLAPVVECNVHNDPPHPAVERARTPELRSRTQRTNERLLHEISSRITRARHARRDAA